LTARRVAPRSRAFVSAGFGCDFADLFKKKKTKKKKNENERIQRKTHGFAKKQIYLWIRSIDTT